MCKICIEYKGTVISTASHAYFTAYFSFFIFFPLVVNNDFFKNQLALITSGNTK